MPNCTTTNLAYRDITKGQDYILVRINYDDELVVNVMRVITEPTYNPDLGVKTFLAQGLSMDGHDLTDLEGAAIELDLDDIGCPWKGDPANISCRTFSYDHIVYPMLVQAVASHPDKWKPMFKDSVWRIHYPINSGDAQSFELPAITSETALRFFSPS